MTDVTTFPIFDGHNDTLLHLHLPKRGGDRSFFIHTDRGHIDLPRAQEGGLRGGLFAIFIPSDPDTPEPTQSDLTITETGYEVRMSPALDLSYAQQMTIAVLARLIRLEAEAAGSIQIVRSADELVKVFNEGRMAVVVHFEGAEAIDTHLDALHVFYQAGLRSLGLVWSRPNAFAHGVPFKFPFSPDTGPGLTEAGRALVQECNQLGIMLDLAHLNEQGFWDVAKLSAAPLVVSHSNAHTLCPVTRNLTDRQLDAIGESDGLVGINFGVSMLRRDGRLDDMTTPLTAIVEHIDYIAQRIGIEHVAFGSDFDGTTIPKELGDVTGLPKLVTALRRSGYDDAALQKLTHENWFRVLRETWKT